MYIIHGQVLCITDTTRYLGLTITSDLKWNSHIQKVTSKANSVLGLLGRNQMLNRKTLGDQSHVMTSQRLSCYRKYPLFKFTDISWQ